MQFCEQIPSQNLKFGYGPAGEIKRRLLTLWNSVKFFVDYANVSDADGEAAGELEPLDHWLLERTEQLVAEMTDAYERYWTPDVIASFESFVDDLSNWYIRRSRRRFWDGDAAALQTLWHALAALARRDRAGDAVPGRVSLAQCCGAEDAPESVFLVPWPEAGERTSSCSPRSRRCGASSSSAVRRARVAAASCASHSVGSSCRARSSAQGHADEIARSCA